MTIRKVSPSDSIQERIVSGDKNTVVITDSGFEAGYLCLEWALRSCLSAAEVVLWITPDAGRAGHIKNIIKKNSSVSYRRFTCGNHYFRFQNGTEIYVGTRHLPYGIVSPSIIILDGCDFFTKGQWDFINSNLCNDCSWEKSRMLMGSALNRKGSGYFRIRARHAKFHPDKFSFFDLRTRFRNELDMTII